MAYVKPNNIPSAGVLDADDIKGNDEELKEYINQKITGGDYGTNVFGTEEFQLGDYQPITNEYSFVSGIATGGQVIDQQIDRAYWTNTIKKARLNDNTLPVWTSLYETSPAIYLERPADILITFGTTSVSAEQEVATSAFWDTTLKLAYTYNDDNELNFIEQTRSYSFEEAAMTTPAAAGNVSPFGATGKPSPAGDEDPEIKRGLRRWIGWSAVLRNLPAGHYKFSVYANAKVEEGYLGARQFKAEVFYT